VKRVLLLTFGLLVSVLLVEAGGRYVFAGTPYVPGKELQFVQSLLQPQSELGYLWQGNLTLDDKILVHWYDQEPDPLCTDADGFRNHPAAIEARHAGAPMDIIGIGDSFIHDAAYVFHEEFARTGRSYYGMAMHRHCPPQYDIILKKYALPTRPRAVIYGLFENDVAETEDFEAWQRSGLDWFTYHSGYWCGPPRDDLTWGANLRGIYALWRYLSAGARAQQRGAAYFRQGALKLRDHVLSAYRATRKADCRFLLVLIPSKETSIHGMSKDVVVYDKLLELLRGEQIPTLDLRTVLGAHPDPASLYYKIDGHWNKSGQRLAARAILAALTR
jgi:SGNH hydrolase-like domain, acetyltransferase AlgX